ncbi:MAG: hypothetical protein A2W91_17250 [Bacteroidetes bacterium GWF2_38_335]|nr:MAG: hypothetical protein A2W91_17250 [Bacteroidetes bacterium GWF2_38_335]OFY81428.1 MAG: hypothetical protein A2281_08225 [Bacteroidetes bacterium RIFOXYA12_FULL_38_20]HBS85557.1 hypothetical protein [Bacteroidales bacterium]
MSWWGYIKAGGNIKTAIMIWSKIRKELHDRLADNLKSRLNYHMTSYKNSTGYIGRAWITYDGVEVINFSNLETWSEFKSLSNLTVGTNYSTHSPVDESKRTEGLLMEKGEFSKYDFGESAWQFINLDIESAIESENAILRALAVLDRRVGIKRLEKIEIKEKHPFVLNLIKLRRKY